MIDYAGFDKVGEECGVFGIYDNDGFDCAKITYYALYSLQHRGQESCGIATCNEGEIMCHKDLGLVPDVFNDRVLSGLKGTTAIGHVRYSTCGSNVRENAQPLVGEYVKGTLAIAHNGNLANVEEIMNDFKENGAVFHTNVDSEVIMYLLVHERIKTHTIEGAIVNAMSRLRGAYSLVVMGPEKLIAARDPWGIRPLCIGKLNNSYIFASETCALTAINAEFVRDVEPGEVVYVDSEGLHSIKDNCGKKKGALCIFEYIYFARPDSEIAGVSVYEARTRAGKILAREHKVDADIVVPVPDSGICAALGYAQESGIPYSGALIKNRYIGRTFIQPTQTEREISVNIKLSVVKQAVEGKRVILVDDSIVRGTTSSAIVKRLREAGAKEVHFMSSAPPFIWPCYFGTDIPSRKQLVACNYTLEEIRKMLDVDTLGYLSTGSLDDLAPNATCGGFCKACFTGEYPFEVKHKD